MRLEKIRAADTIGDTAAAAALFGACFDGLAHEEIRVAHVDADLRLIKLIALPGKGLDSVELPLRPLIRDALMLGSPAMILAHNHPGGSAEPSRSDIAATRRLVAIARPLNIRLLDHLIFAGDAVTSFRALGLL